MIANLRIKAIREYRGLQSRELAKRAGLSRSEISLLESKLRKPNIDTLQKLAGALEVSSSYLLGEEDAELPLAHALAKQSLKALLRESRLSDDHIDFLERVCRLDSAPDSIKGWKNLLQNLSEYQLGPPPLKSSVR